MVVLLKKSKNIQVFIFMGQGLKGQIEYENNIFVDVKILTREQLQFNKFFYDEVVNQGMYYERKVG